MALADAELEVFCQGTFTIAGATDRWLRGLTKGWREQLADIRARVASRALARNRDSERVEAGLAIGVDRARGEDSTAVATLERQPNGELHVFDVQFPNPSHQPELPPVVVAVKPEAAEVFRAELAVRLKTPAVQPPTLELTAAEAGQPRTKRCTNCNGQGKVVTRNAFMHPCPVCKATGRIPA